FFAALDLYDRARQRGSHGVLAEQLGVHPSSLARLWVGESEDGTFSSWPEWGDDWNASNIVRRFADGRKLAVPGQRRGIYQPCGEWEYRAQVTGHLVICEGGSDTAAADSMGLA